VKSKERKKGFRLGGNAKRETTRFGFCQQHFFVKHTNQGEFVKFCLMLQSAKERGAT